MANINNLNTNDQLPAFIRREDDTELNVVAIWNAPPAVRTYITMADPSNPTNTKEARDVSEVCLMIGLPIPVAAFTMLGGRQPNIRRRRMFSPQPMSESKRNARNYAIARDNECGTVNMRGAMVNHGTHGLDVYLATRHGIPAAGIVPYIRDHEDMELEITTLRQQLAAGSGAGQTDLQQQLTAANNQLVAMTAERDAARQQVAAIANQLTTSNGDLARAVNERNVAVAEAASLRAAQHAIRTNIGSEVANMIRASPQFLGDSGFSADTLSRVADEVTRHFDFDRMVDTIVGRADTGIGSPLRQDAGVEADGDGGNQVMGM